MAPPVEIPHLYIHVPFCPTICPFCSFHVLRRRDELVDAYLARLDAELAATAEAWPDSGPLRSVYLGGGTPSQLTDQELERLLGSVRQRFALAADVELSMECHPLNVLPSRPPRWRELGFNRISLGLQSTQDDVLRTLGRPHDAAAGLAALDAVLAVDGWTVNADLIVAVAGQDVAADLHRVGGSGVTHLAAYTLTIEAGTPFERRGVRVEEEAERAALLLAGDILPGYGLSRYEVSNHARPGHECTHNLGYWRGHCWFGAGPSATAHLPSPDGVGRLLLRNTDLDRWLDGAPASEERLDAVALARTRLLTGLRLREGLALRELGPDELGPDVLGAVGVERSDPDASLGALRRQIDRLCDAGRLIVRGDRLFAHPDELPVLDRLLAELW